MINLGFIGAGRMGGFHAETLKKIEGVAIKSVFDPNVATAQAFAKAHGVERVCSSEDEVAKDKSLDAVLVCNYSDQHYNTMVRLLDAGKKRIFCEKALVRKLADGEDLLKRAAKAKAVVMVGHHRRHQPGYIALRKAILDGRIGRPLMARVGYCHPGYCRQWGDFFADFDRCGGVILDMMSHLFDQLNWYFGDIESASGLSLMFDRANGLPVDFMSSTLKYKNGVICNVEGSWQRYGAGYDRIEVYGDKGTALFDNSDKLHIYSPGERVEISLPKSESEMEAFVKMVKTGEEPVNDLRAGFESVRVALGVIDAAKTCKVHSFK